MSDLKAPEVGHSYKLLPGFKWSGAAENDIVLIISHEEYLSRGGVVQHHTSYVYFLNYTSKLVNVWSLGASSLRQFWTEFVCCRHFKEQKG